MKQTIMLVEDNPQNRYLATFLLTQAGMEVLEATCGAEAFELLEQRTPELILMDIQLPELDGYQVALKIKANPSLAHIPIIALTSFAMPGDRQKAEAMGFAGYIEKPIDPIRFVNQVRGCLPTKGANE